MTIPDRSTIWSFKNRLIEVEVLDEIWNELQHQIDALELQVKRGVIQDATFHHFRSQSRTGRETKR